MGSEMCIRDSLALPQAKEATRSRFGRDVPGDRVNSTMTKVEEIRMRLERGTYTIDAAKVAEAIVARLLAGRSARESSPR